MLVEIILVLVLLGLAGLGAWFLVAAFSGRRRRR